MTTNLPVIREIRRLTSPAVTPQALTWHNNALWVSSRDAKRLYGVDVQNWTVFEEMETPGTPWAAVSSQDSLLMTSGEGADDDRYLRRYIPRQGFDPQFRVALPEFTGSYLSFSFGKNIYVSQWYKHRVLQIDALGEIVKCFPIGAEICGHVIVGEQMFVLRGTEADGEDWHVARVDLEPATPVIEPLARVPFACRSLAFDGISFWTNHREADETVEFSLP